MFHKSNPKPIPTREEIAMASGMKNLKTTRKRHKRVMRYRLKANILSFLAIVTMSVLGVSMAILIEKSAHTNYSEKLDEITLSMQQNFFDYEEKFLSAIANEQQEKVSSNIVSASNKSALNDYISSLYRHSTNRIEPSTFKDTKYYLISDNLILDKYRLSDTTSNVIFPGAILKGDSLFSDAPTLVAAKRTPIDLISNQTNGKSVQVSNPTYSNVTDVLNQYANDYSGDTSKEWEYTLHSVSSSKELNATLGIGFQGSELDLGYGSSNMQSSVAITYSQIYYTVSSEPKATAVDYFANGVDLQVLGTNEPAYVSSVDYGRKVILMVSGNMSQKELSAKLEIAQSKEVSIGAGISNIKKDETLHLETVCYGGKDISPILNTEEKDVGIIGNIKATLFGKENKGLEDQLNAALSDGSPLINPVPISYRLKYLSDNSEVPAMYINQENILLADNTELITLSLENNKPFTIDTRNTSAILWNKEDLTFQDGKATGSYFEILCNSAYPLTVPITYEKEEVMVDLAECERNQTEDVPIPVRTLFTVGNFNIMLHVYKTDQLNSIQ